LAYKTTEYLAKHLKEKHPEAHNAQGKNVLCDFKCCFCVEAFPDRVGLIQHLNGSHELTLEKEYFEFPAFSDFQQFVDTIDDARFANRKGCVRRPDSQTHYFYVCNRSMESARTKTRNRSERIVRKTNSIKIDSNCLAYISALEHSDGKLGVEYLEFHTCHRQGDEVKYRLTRATKADIDAQLVQGLSIERIVKNMTAKLRDRDSRDDALKVLNQILKIGRLHITCRTVSESLRVKIF
jgi:hypothetical protein